ncbi:hypothetical protein [Brevundimonas subvibrioides]|uniref:hypothetical protein n=1 Tax=Brevundimonas subvibrioides TaxID=74313 RepID=UPI0022B45AF6|nr:hypothetical protein [Brevundimonas subvibrioides]
MTLLAIIAATAALQGGWTWTLYEGEGPLVLANEVPDTAQLRTTFQCAPGSGVARVDLYGGPGGSGFATLTSGGASATAETTRVSDRQSVVLRTDHPVFGAFMVTGTLDVAVGERHQTVEVPATHRGRLRRFAELCAG